MKYLLNTIALLWLLLLSAGAFSQVSTLGNSGAATDYVGWDNAQPFPLQIRHNANQPMEFFTNSIQRIRLNHNVNYAVNGDGGQARNGFVLIGQNNNLMGGGPVYNNGAFSLLHLNGDGSEVQQFGYRNWMRTGITMTGNRDLSYFGLRYLGTTGEDVTETTIAWSDNPLAEGPDDLAFRFLSGAHSSVISSDFGANNDLDGLHVARFTPTGQIGFGSTFGVNAPGMSVGYVRPASLLHMSLNRLQSVYAQFTNRDVLVASGTEETAADGLRIGIHGSATESQVNGHALIYQQEKRPLLLSTNANTTTMNIETGATRERMRIMSVGTPTHLEGFVYDVHNPGNIDIEEITRVSISHNPAVPVTRPMSLFHLGYNAGNLTVGNYGGWRDWMDLGTFISYGSDHMYIGMKQEGPYHRQDAIIGWGDNQVHHDGSPPDNLRFIFSADPTDMFGNPASISNDGLETARIIPQAASTLSANDNFGMMGIGDFSPSGPNAAAALQVDAKLDIDGDLRIRVVEEDSELTRVLVIDENDLNRVHWIDISDIQGQCDWNVIDNGASNSQHWDLAMGFAGACAGRNVGIGDVPPANSRLFVTDSFSNNNENGILVQVSGDQDGQTGINVQMTNSGENGNCIGVRSEVIGGSELWAGRFTAIANNNLNNNFAALEGSASNLAVPLSTPIGVYGFGSTNQVGTRSIGIYGEAVALTPGAAFAGYFAGQSVQGLPTVGISDESIKTNIEDITNATEVLSQLKPRSYNYITATDNLNFLDGSHSMGFIAQEIQQVLPNIVVPFVHPGVWDEYGNQISQDVDLLGVKYTELIPIIVAGLQEQQTTIEAQSAQLTELQSEVQGLKDQVNTLIQLYESCCEAGGTPKALNQPQGPQDEGMHYDLKIEQPYLGQNVPNPFMYETSITYRIPEQAMVRVRILTQGGQHIDTLVDGLMPKGEYRIVWNASHLPAGLYFYTLEADGVELVKKAVKL
jgi:hypothetical protein